MQNAIRGAAKHCRASLLGVLPALLGLWLPIVSHATPLRIDFAGEIDRVEDPQGVIADGFGVGTDFRGFLEFDPEDGVDGEPFGFRKGSWVFDGFIGGGGFFPISTGATIGGVATVHRFLASPQVISVLDDFPLEPDGVHDVWMPPGFGDPGFIAVPLTTCGLALVDTRASALSGDFFVPLDLEAFDQPRFSCRGLAAGEDGSDVRVASLSGRITRWTVTPEPLLSALLMSGAAFLWVRTRGCPR